MRYFKDSNDEIYGYEDDFPDNFIREGLIRMTDEEVEAMHQQNEQDRVAILELSWAGAEYAAIDDIIRQIEDEDEDAPPGTVKDWREYRKALRRWNQDAEGFPSEEHRPARPE